MALALILLALHRCQSTSSFEDGLVFGQMGQEILLKILVSLVHSWRQVWQHWIFI
jgi:hypothetical protein